MKPECREKLNEMARAMAKRMSADSDSAFGKGHNPIPITVLNTGENYPSIKDCALDLNIPANQISLAIKRNGTVHGYKIRKI